MTRAEWNAEADRLNQKSAEALAKEEYELAEFYHQKAAAARACAAYGTEGGDA